MDKWFLKEFTFPKQMLFYAGVKALIAAPGFR